MRKAVKIFSITVFLLVIIYSLFLQNRYPIYAIRHSFIIGDSVDSFNNIVVFNNGMNYSQSYGKHYTKDSSFYFGKKWQCVEFVKRYYFEHFNHKMPNGFGNAKDFFDTDLLEGELNKERDLIQYRNGDTIAPMVDDILVFGGKFGHVAIVTMVMKNEIEVIQQNIYMTPRERFKLKIEDRKYIVGENRKPEGWLRMK
ncbi:MAG: CHAP domain-containing protein [Bacteroidetes bacterium]|nr:CHAP domain-containing protein [Bacteroidota bacterium]